MDARSISRRKPKNDVDNASKTSKIGLKATKPGSRTERTVESGPSRRWDGKKEEDDVLEHLNKALKAFPPSCTGDCDPGKYPEKCTHDDDREHSNEDKETALHKYEAETLQNLKMVRPTSAEKDTILHIMVKRWHGQENWCSKQKRFLKWMLEQPAFGALLERQNHNGATPMHLALSEKLDEFVDCVLQRKEHSRIGNILSVKSKKEGNCLHIASTQHDFPKLGELIKKLPSDSDVLITKDKSNGDTPLHIAVKHLSLQLPLVTSNRFDATPQFEDDNDDANSQSFESVDSVFSLESEYTDGGSTSDGNSSERHDAETPNTERYRLETDDERLKRVRQVLLSMEKETVKPRPPMPENSDTVVRFSVTEPPARRSAAASSSFALPSTHSIPLLVEAMPKALTIENDYGRTPYREREEALLQDPVVQEVVNTYAQQIATDVKKTVNPARDSPMSTEDRKRWAERMIIIADPVAHYIRSYCLRKSNSREETMSCLYQPGKERHIEFDLAGMPNNTISQAYLDQLARHLKFESILKYVALPALTIEHKALRSSPDRQTSQHDRPDLSRGGRSDLVTVFDWLWRNGVREIIKVTVVDDRDRPHADASIVEALYGFKVEEWDWKRVDLCSDVIYDASPAVREVSLYSSGNNAVLMSWASSEGLGNRVRFPHLAKVTIYVKDGLEDQVTGERNTDRCRAAIGEWSKLGDRQPIEVRIIHDKNEKSYSSEFSNAIDEGVPPWIESVENFSCFLKAASGGKDCHVTPVKIAIIDDGIDATNDDLQEKIAGGATFFPYPFSPNLVNSYFVPRGNHGTRMAQLICRLCPDVRLYIARLEELSSSTGNGRRFTARSAAKAVNWAISCGVDIISMSWTIHSTTPQEGEMRDLEEAIIQAHSDKILMFCSASDQGENKTETCFPGDWTLSTRIGGATFAGDKLTWVHKKVDFWFPGRDVPFPSNDGKTVVSESGSSVATAAASGLAAVLIYASRLVYGNNIKKFQDKLAMETAFSKMSTGGDQKFPRTEEYLCTIFRAKLFDAKATKKKQVKIETLHWDEASRKALESLIKQLQG